MKNTQDITTFLLPRVKLLMLGLESDLKNNIKSWLSQKGWLQRFVGGSLVDPVWKLIIGPLLPVIIKLVVDIVIGTASPALLPFIPLINHVLDYISNEVLSDQDKQNFKEILAVVQNFKPTPQVKTVLSLSYHEVKEIQSNQEFFDSI